MSEGLPSESTDAAPVVPHGAPAAEREGTTGRIRLDLLWPRLESIADEVAATLVKTAFSHDVVECRDMAVAVCDEQGRLLAHSHLGATGHIGSVPGLMRELLLRHPIETIRDGDAFASNDPWIASGHTPDVFVACPLFLGGTPAAWIVSAVHHADIGGRAGAGDVSEIYEEGLLLPIVRLQSAYTEAEDVAAIVRRNVRFGDHVVGDLRAQVAAARTGLERLATLLTEQDLPVLSGAGDEIIERTERAMRASILELGVGTYTASCELDTVNDDGVPLQLRLRLTITPDGTLEADFAGTSPQVRSPINCPIQYALAYAVVATKLACRADVPTNEGAYRAITVKAPEGSLLNPIFPAPVFWRLSTGLLVAELILRCAFAADPDRVPAESGSLPVWQFYVTGTRTDGTPFSLHQHGFGGMGARPHRDGLDSISFPYNVRDVSIEGSELESPLLITRRELREGSGGDGEYRGGLGETITITAAPAGDLNPLLPLVLSGGAGRFGRPAAGVTGGSAGAAGRICLDGVALAPSELGNSPHVRFRPDQSITLDLPGGGGYGDPSRRSPAAAETDRAERLVTP
jgi:N-methylhydantoinase B/oxoprolinase/acetone carboxylase alpha subunit